MTHHLGLPLHKWVCRPFHYSLSLGRSKFMMALVPHMQPSLIFYCKNPRNQYKIPYVKFGIDDVVILFNKDEEEIKMYNLVCGVPEGLVMLKKHAITMAELDEKMAKRMNDNITQKRFPKTTKARIEDGIDLVGAQETEKIVQEMHAQLMGYFVAMNARPHVVYAPPPNGS